MLVIQCPKRAYDLHSDFPYDYYAGYSQSFVQALLEHLPLSPRSVVLDPWNGSGTTTAVAARLGYQSIGIDLNPVMNVVARCRLDDGSGSSAITLWEKICKRVRTAPRRSLAPSDPLNDWFSPGTAATLRSIAANLYTHTTRPSDASSTSTAVDRVLLACFVSIQELLSSLKTSNPTWIRRPRNDEQKVTVSTALLLQAIRAHVEAICQMDSCPPGKKAKFLTVNSSAIPLEDESIDVVLTSPPYCTRIDYAVATAGELAFLGLETSTAYRTLRQNLIGTTTVYGGGAYIRESFGPTCDFFLSELKSHASKASSTYYLKNHLAYFNGIKASIVEISRLLKKEGIAIFVVQDSWYKNLHNDLPKIFEEMAASAGLRLFQREDFAMSQSMSHLNGSRRKFSIKKLPTETVLALYKP